MVKHRQSFIRTEVKNGMRKALLEGYRYGKGKTMFRPTKANLHEANTPSRYKGKGNRTWLKKAKNI